jgi:hypothetical protein
LGDYGAHLFGGNVVWSPHRIPGRMGFLDRFQFDIGYERYFNTNNFSANIYQAALGVTF